MTRQLVFVVAFVLTIVTAGTAAGVTSPDKGEIALRLDVEFPAMHMGETLKRALFLPVPDIDSRVVSTRSHLKLPSGVNTFRFELSESGFAYPFSFIPSHVGTHKLGPFRLTVLDVELESNALEIAVLPPLPADGSFSILASKETLRLGESVDLRIKQSSRLPADSSRDSSSNRLTFASGDSSAELKLKESDRFDAKFLGKSSQVAVNNEKGTSLTVTKYRIWPKQAGKLVIDKHAFKNPAIVLRKAIIEVQGERADPQTTTGADTVPAPSEPLMRAVREGQMATVQALLDRGADLNANDRDGGTPLMMAAILGRDKIAQMLLASGADVNARDGEGKTALMWAAWKGDDSIVRTLLANGADLNAKDIYGITALMKAESAGHKGTVQLLRAMGSRE